MIPLGRAPAFVAARITGRPWKSVVLTLFPWILSALDAAGYFVNDGVVTSQAGLLSTYTNPNGSSSFPGYCGRSLGLPSSAGIELGTALWVAVAISVLTVAWCVLRLRPQTRRDRAGSAWVVVVTGLALIAFALFNIMAAHATLAAAVPVPDMFGCPNAPVP